MSMTHQLSLLAHTNVKVYQDEPMTPAVMDTILISFQLLSMHHYHTKVDLHSISTQLGKVNFFSSLLSFSEVNSIKERFQ